MPVAMANKCGPWSTTPPGTLPRLIWRQMNSRFPGFSHIADGDGSEVARVPAGEGIAFGKVHLDESRKRSAVPAQLDTFKPWIARLPPEYGYFRYFESWGHRWYGKRAAALRSVEAANPPSSPSAQA